jgi:nitrogen regulatory protein PII
MKRIDAIIKTLQLDDVAERLRLIGVTGMTVAAVSGMSSSTETDGVFRGQRYRTQSAPRYQLTIVVTDDVAANVVNAIARAGRTESRGDGIIMVSDLTDVVRIHTGEANVDTAAIAPPSPAAARTARPIS